MSEVHEYFSEDIEAPGCLSSLKILLYNLNKTPGVLGGPEHFSEVSEASECLSSL